MTRKAASNPKSTNRQIVDINLDLLTFDLQNPRLPEKVNADNEVEVITWMLQDATIVELISSIGEHGYFGGEPLLVIREGNKFTVVEGNRRLAALKLLDRPSLATTKKKAVAEAVATAKVHPKEIPCVVYQNRKEILIYLGYRHVTGVKPWDPLAKAKYLEQLLPSIKGTGPSKLKELARAIGSRSDYVGRLLSGLAIFKVIKRNRFYGIKGLDEDELGFSVLTTALNYKGIATFLGIKEGSDTKLKTLKPNNLKELVQWLFEEDQSGVKRVNESRKLSELDDVVTSKAALAEFRAGLNLEDSAKLARVTKDDPNQLLLVLLIEANGLFSRIQSQIDKQKKLSAEQKSLLDDLKGKLNKITSSVK